MEGFVSQSPVNLDEISAIFFVQENADPYSEK
jgi:hypothetical protein